MFLGKLSSFEDVDEVGVFGTDLSRGGDMFFSTWTAGIDISCVDRLTRDTIIDIHQDDFFSARRLGIDSGRILSGIMIRK